MSGAEYSGVAVNHCSGTRDVHEVSHTSRDVHEVSHTSRDVHISLLSKQKKYAQFESVNLDNRSNLANFAMNIIFLSLNYLIVVFNHRHIF